MEKIRIFDIEWDTDGEDVNLPTEVIIDDLPEDEMKELINNIGWFDDDLANELSDRYGWCVYTFNAEVI